MTPSGLPASQTDSREPEAGPREGPGLVQPTLRRAAIAFVGATLIPSELVNFPAASTAGNQYQYGLLSACSRQWPDRVTALTVAPYRMWKGHGKLLSGYWRRRTPDSLDIRSVPYVNVLVIKQLTIAISLLIGIILWAWANRKSSHRSIVVYNTVAYLAGPAKVAAFLTRSELVALVADVPDAGLDEWVPSKAITRLEYALRWHMMNRADRLIFLTERAGEDLSGGRPYMVVEGGITRSQTVSKPKDNRSARRIVHAGSLGYLAGIELALEAMLDVSVDGATFHIYGGGPRESIVALAETAQPSRIVFHGRVSHPEAIRAEREASVLVCPRLPDGVVTPYTFPSKLYEYLATGVPVVCNNLEGIPSESLQFLNVPDEPSPESWARLIDLILTDEGGKYLDRAKAGAAFVASRKNWDAHAQRVVGFLTDGAMT